MAIPKNPAFRYIENVPIAKLSILFCVFVSVSFGATYKGKNIDGKKYAASIKSAKEIFGGSVEFDGQFAYLSFNTQIITVKLENENIEDLRSIPANDKTHYWEISVDEDPASINSE
jgi:hypothetical protein